MIQQCPWSWNWRLIGSVQSILQTCRISGSCNGDWRSLAFGMWGHVFWNKFAVSEQHAATIFRVEAYSEVEDSRLLCNFWWVPARVHGVVSQMTTVLLYEILKFYKFAFAKVVCYIQNGFSFRIISLLLKLYQHLLNRQGVIPSGKQKSVLCRNKNSVLQCRM